MLSDSLEYSPRLPAILLNPSFLARRGLFLDLTALIAHLTPAPGETWVDVGCGMRPYESLLKGCHYVGVDIDQSGREPGQKRPDLYYDGRSLPLPDQSVDGVLCTEVLEHVFDFAALLAEINRILKPGGHLILALPLTWELHEKPYDFFRFTEFGVSRLLDETGFEIIEARKSCGALQTIAQLTSTYIASELIGLLPRGKSIFLATICAPIQMAGLLLGKILPDRGNLYINGIVLARITR